jgi:hypothetical protein
MKVDKTRNKELTKLYLSNKSIRNKERVINLLVFTMVFFITIMMISQIL